GGVYSNLLSSKHNAVFASPRFRIDSDSISVRMLGGSYSFAQLIIENYAVPRGGIYNLRLIPKDDHMEWRRFDPSFWKGFTAYVEWSPMNDATHFAPVDGPQKDKLPVPKDGRSWFGTQAVWFHNNKLTPKSEPAATLHLLEGGAPDSPEALAG